MITRYILEYAIVIPTAVFALLPVIDDVKLSSRKFYGTVGIFLAAFILTQAYISSSYVNKVRNVFIPGLFILFAAYYFCVDVSFSKKLFCFSNAIMLCVLCPMYTITLMAPDELTNILWTSSGLFTLKSCLVNLGLAILLGAIFFRTLTVKLRILLREERVNAVWKFLCLFPFAMTLLIYWMTPISPMVVVTGRVRPISLVLYAVMPAFVYLLYHVFWWTTTNLIESANLQQENNLLQIEKKRYNELRNYMNETKILRHDTRQHMLVISQLLKSGKYSELDEYISQLTDKVNTGYKIYCANNSVDAIASHYDAIADAQATNINWSLELPATLPLNDSDYCAMLGNLLENALKAVKDLAPEKRRVKVISSMLSQNMLGLSIDNPYEGKINLGKDGLPVSEQPGHGIGLISVANIVNRYGGSLNINTENQIFSVDIILF